MCEENLHIFKPYFLEPKYVEVLFRLFCITREASSCMDTRLRLNQKLAFAEFLIFFLMKVLFEDIQKMSS